MKPSKLQRGIHGCYCYDFAWSRGIDPAQEKQYSCLFQSKREVYHDYFSLKSLTKSKVTSICLKSIPVQ